MATIFHCYSRSENNIAELGITDVATIPDHESKYFCSIDFSSSTGILPAEYSDECDSILNVIRKWLETVQLTIILFVSWSSLVTITFLLYDIEQYRKVFYFVACIILTDVGPLEITYNGEPLETLQRYTLSVGEKLSCRATTFYTDPNLGADIAYRWITNLGEESGDEIEITEGMAGDQEFVCFGIDPFNRRRFQQKAIRFLASESQLLLSCNYHNSVLFENCRPIWERIKSCYGYRS